MTDRIRLDTLLGEPSYAMSQIAIAVWLVVASRIQTATPPDLSGVLDDASLVLLFVALQVGIARATGAHRGLFVVFSLLAMTALSWAVFTNAVFFSFFHTPMSVAAIRLVGIVADASSSVSELLGFWSVGALLLAPIAAQAFALYRVPRALSAPGAPSVQGGKGALTLCFLGLLAASAASATREPVLLVAQHNPTLALVRDVGSRVLGAVFPGSRIASPAGQADVLSLLNREGFEGYRFAGTPTHPLLQQAVDPGELSSPPRNVVVILMESMRSLEMQGRFRDARVTPRLNALESESVVYSNFYSNGMTTVDGEFSLLCSALPVVDEPPVYVRKPRLDIRCLPEILAERGYGTHWISAYRSSYANKQLFLQGHGVKRMHDRKTFAPARAQHPPVGWGMGDIDMFEQAIQKIRRFREPFFAEIMTLSNHHPFDHDYDIEFPEALSQVEGSDHYRNYLRGMHYTDRAIGEFLAAAREEPWFERTLFVIVGDHAVRSYPAAARGELLGPLLETEVYFRTRLQLYGPGWLSPAVDPTLGSQIDVAPTILDLLGIRADNSFLGVSLMADVPHERRFVLSSIGHVWNVRVGDDYCYSVGYSCFEKVFPRCPKGQQPTSSGHTCFESTRDLLEDDSLTGQTTSHAPRSLDALERLKLMDRAGRVMELNEKLIEEDGFR